MNVLIRIPIVFDVHLHLFLLGLGQLEMYQPNMSDDAAKLNKTHATILISTAEWPDTSMYTKMNAK